MLQRQNVLNVLPVMISLLAMPGPAIFILAHKNSWRLPCLTLSFGTPSPRFPCQLSLGPS